MSIIMGWSTGPNLEDIPGDTIDNVLTSVVVHPRLILDVQIRLHQLVRAWKCWRAEMRFEKQYCNPKRRYCRRLMWVLHHMQSCDVIKNCPTYLCSSSRQILTHWKACRKRPEDCSVCSVPQWRYAVLLGLWEHSLAHMHLVHFCSMVSKIAQQTGFNLSNLSMSGTDIFLKAKTNTECYHMIAEVISQIETEHQEKNWQSAEVQNLVRAD